MMSQEEISRDERLVLRDLGAIASHNIGSFLGDTCHAATLLIERLRAERPSSEELASLKANKAEADALVRTALMTVDALQAELASLKAERETFRRALESAAILLNISESKEQPYTSDYDTVHDAYNEVWHAWKMAERALHPAGSGEGK